MIKGCLAHLSKVVFIHNFVLPLSSVVTSEGTVRIFAMIVAADTPDVHMGPVDGSVAVVAAVVVATAVVVVAAGVVAIRYRMHTHSDVQLLAGPVCCLLVCVGGQTGDQTGQQHLRIHAQIRRTRSAR